LRRWEAPYSADVGGGEVRGDRPRDTVADGSIGRSQGGRRTGLVDRRRALRTAVWDHLHEFSEPTPLGPDIDLIFFDPDDLSEEREGQIEEALRARLPGAPWEATNQATVHAWYPEKFGEEVEPFNAAAEAVAT
jgi:Nucleotidyltransferase